MSSPRTHLVDGTLKFARSLAAIGLVVAIRTVGGAIADEIFVDTLARLTTELIRPTGGTAHLVGFVWTILLSITTPRGWYTIFVHITISGHGSSTSEVIRSTGRQSTTIFLILQQH